MAKSKAKKPVLVTTEFRGVFFGYLKEFVEDKKIARLEKARNCVSWGSSVKGFLGLAANGPDESCRIGPAADIDLMGVTSISKVTPNAAKAWEAEPWD